MASALEVVEDTCYDSETGGWDYQCLAGIGVIGSTLLVAISEATEDAEGNPWSQLPFIDIDPEVWVQNIEHWFYNELLTGLSGEWNLDVEYQLENGSIWIDWDVEGCAACSGDPESSGICIGIGGGADTPIGGGSWNSPSICIDFTGGLSSQITPNLNLQFLPKGYHYDESPAQIWLAGGTGSGTTWGVGIDTEEWLLFNVSWDIGINADGADDPVFQCGEDFWCAVADSEESCMERGIFPHPNDSIFESPPGNENIRTGAAFPGGYHPGASHASCCQWRYGECSWNHRMCERGHVEFPHPGVTCSGFGDYDTCTLFGSYGFNGGTPHPELGESFIDDNYMHSLGSGDCYWYNPVLQTGEGGDSPVGTVHHLWDHVDEEFKHFDYIQNEGECIEICLAWDMPSWCEEGQYCDPFIGYQNFINSVFDLGFFGEQLDPEGMCEDCMCTTKRDCQTLGFTEEYDCVPAIGTDWNCLCLIPGCTHDGDCEEGQHCEFTYDDNEWGNASPIWNSGEPILPYGQCVDDCESDSDCDYDQQCVDGWCNPICQGEQGCMDECYIDYNPSATCPAPCTKPCYGCVDEIACNYYNRCDPDYKCEYINWPGNYVPLSCVECDPNPNNVIGEPGPNSCCSYGSTSSCGVALDCCECGQSRDACGQCGNWGSDVLGNGGCVKDCCNKPCCGFDCNMWQFICNSTTPLPGAMVITATPSEVAYCEETLNGYNPWTLLNPIWFGNNAQGPSCLCCPPTWTSSSDGGVVYDTCEYNPYASYSEEEQAAMNEAAAQSACGDGGACVGKPKCAGC